jgi:Permeases of the major facilitator superfamily
LSRYLISIYDWRTAYLIIAIIAWVVLFLVAWVIRHDPKDIGLLPLGVVENSKLVTEAQPSSLVKGSDFSLSEAIRTQSFWMLVVMHALCAFCTQIPMAHLVPYATDAGIPAATAAIAVSIVGIFCIIGKIVLGNAGDRFGIKRIIAISVGVEAIALLSLIWVKNIPELFAFAAIFGLAFGGWVPQFPALTGRFFGSTSMGIIFGVIMMGAMIGASTGPTLAGHIFDISGSYNWGFLAAAIAAAIMFVLTFFIKPPKPRKDKMH